MAPVVLLAIPILVDNRVALLVISVSPLLPILLLEMVMELIDGAGAGAMVLFPLRPTPVQLDLPLVVLRVQKRMQALRLVESRIPIPLLLAQAFYTAPLPDPGPSDGLAEHSIWAMLEFVVLLLVAREMIILPLPPSLRPVAIIGMPALIPTAREILWSPLPLLAVWVETAMEFRVAMSTGFPLSAYLFPLTPHLTAPTGMAEMLCRVATANPGVAAH